LVSKSIIKLTDFGIKIYHKITDFGIKINYKINRFWYQNLL